jgi:hypothetical protein
MRSAGHHLLCASVFFALFTIPVFAQSAGSQTQLPSNVQRDAHDVGEARQDVQSDEQHSKEDIAVWNKLHQELARDKAKLQQDQAKHASAAEIAKDRAAVQHDTELIQAESKKAHTDRAHVDAMEKQLNTERQEEKRDRLASDEQHYKADMAEWNKLHQDLARDKARLQQDEANKASAAQIAKDRAAVENDTQLIRAASKKAHADRQHVSDAQKLEQQH